MPLDADQDFSMMRSAMKAEMLDADTELALAYAWRDNRDEKALHRLINAYMRLAISSAKKFQRSGIPMNDLVQEAGLGLMKAAEKFDPDKGFRFSTYAVWWVRASLQDYVMRNWSMVRTGSSSAQKTLFFNLRRVQAKFEREAQTHGETTNALKLRENIAAELGVSLRSVEEMQGRLNGQDLSLNATVSVDNEGIEWIDALEDDGLQVDEIVEKSHDTKRLQEWLSQALEILTEREKFIVVHRRLNDKPRTLSCLAQELNLSKERVRQVEAAALEKMRKMLEGGSYDLRNFFTL
jgi:RNA polymerase sigma-32 factor